MPRPVLMNVEIEKLTLYGFCTGCCAPLLPEQVEYAHHWTYQTSRFTRFTLRPVCGICSSVDCALQEAKAEQRRFTEIGCMSRNDEDEDSDIWTKNGFRCYCGAVTHQRLKFCVRCSQRSRMLDKVSAQNRLVAKVLKELRSTIREKKRELTETT